MPVGKARKDPIRTATRTTGAAGADRRRSSFWVRKGRIPRRHGDTRTITLQHTHRDDSITVTFKRNGRYDDEGLKKLNYFLRDWRTDDVTTMDPQLFDAVWEVVREFGPDKVGPHRFVVPLAARPTRCCVSRSSGVARHSPAHAGQGDGFLYSRRAAGTNCAKPACACSAAASVFIRPQARPSCIWTSAMCGMWPRMTREQLARVFPDGRTVHLPIDGKPLAGFALAQADIEKRESLAVDLRGRAHCRQRHEEAGQSALQAVRLQAEGRRRGRFETRRARGPGAGRQCGAARTRQYLCRPAPGQARS